MNDSSIEILSVLAEYGDAMSSREIARELRIRGFSLESRTVRYHLKKLEEAGLIEKTANGKSKITLKGIEELKRKSVFERLGEFSERIEFNAYFCNFDLYKMRGLVPTNVAIVDKAHFDDAIEVILQMQNFDLLISNLVALADEGENFGGLDVPSENFVIGVISNTIYDVIMRYAGISLLPEFSGLLHCERVGEKLQPSGFTELISYSGTTLSPGWLMVKSGLTSVYRCMKNGRGEIIAAVRSFSRHAIEIVREEVQIAKNKGFGGVIEVSYPSSRKFSLPQGNRARLIVTAGLNYLAPLHELGFNPDLRIIEVFVEFSDFKPPDSIS